MDVRFWGPPFWETMHQISFNYPQINPSEENKKAVKTWFTTLQHLLPCESCRIHFANLLKDYPIQLQNRDSLTRWLVEIHNRVNDRLGKPRMAYEVAAEKYKQLMATCSPPQMESNLQCKPQKIPVCAIGALVLIALVIGFWVYDRSRVGSENLGSKK